MFSGSTQMNGWVDGQTGRQVSADGEGLDERGCAPEEEWERGVRLRDWPVNARTQTSAVETVGDWTDRWRDTWMDGQMDGWVDGRMDGRVDGWVNGWLGKWRE